MPEIPSEMLEAPWLGLIIGNTRLHWALFQGQTLQGVWHTRHCTPDEAEQLIQQKFSAAGWRSLIDHVPSPPLKRETLPTVIPALADASPSLLCASVVPSQTAVWRSLPQFHEITLEQVPLANLYPTLGIDRALNLLGAGDRYGWPSLVIDAGTALTFTAGKEGALVGGAILPGMATQFTALAQNTAALPALKNMPELPPRWANTTAEAIRSGILHGILATIHDFVIEWFKQNPNGHAILTGGDAPILHPWLTQRQRPLSVTQDADLMWQGLKACRNHWLTNCQST